MSARKGRSKKAYPPSPTPVSKTGELVATGKEKAEVLNFLPQSSLATSLPPPPEWMDRKTGTEGAKSLPLQKKIRFVTA